MNKLNVNLTIPIPTDLVIIQKIEYDELFNSSLSGRFWSMKDLEVRLNKKHEWIKEHILYPEKYRSLLDIECGGFVYYPKTKGQNWSFHAARMAEFLDQNFQTFFHKYLNL